MPNIRQPKPPINFPKVKPTISANVAAGRVVKIKKSTGVTPGKRSKKGM